LAFGQRRCQGFETRGFGEYFFCALPGFKLTQGVAGAKKYLPKSLTSPLPKPPKCLSGQLAQYVNGSE
jgi:hypothetical protein